MRSSPFRCRIGRCGGDVTQRRCRERTQSFLGYQSRSSTLGFMPRLWRTRLLELCAAFAGSVKRLKRTHKTDRYGMMLPMGKLSRHAAVAFRDVVQNGWVASSLVPVGLRGRALRRLGHDIHPTAGIKPGQWLGATNGLTVGANSFINYGCFFDLGAPTTIGANTHFGYGVRVLTCTHVIGPADKRCGESTAAPVVIGDGCWIGADVVIQPGVTIGSGCVVATGSVVVKDCEPNTMYAGVPAVLKGSLPDASPHLRSANTPVR